METALILVLCLILKIVSVQMENKKRREEEQEGRNEEADMGQTEETATQPPKRQLPFEIPTIRQADPNAETKLPQADRIFVRQEKTAEAEAVQEPKHESKPRSSSEPAASHVNPLYLERLAMTPTMHAETAESPAAKEKHTETSARIPTDRERLIEGIILAEVLGRPKAYQKGRRIR